MIDSKLETRRLNSAPRVILRLQPLFKSQHYVVLIFFRAASEEFGEHRAGEYREGLARVRQDISPITQVINGQRFAVVAPEFRNAEGRVDGELRD